MTKYWALKTREDKDPERGIYVEHWPEFKRKRLVAIGWELSPDLRKSKPNLESITCDDLVEDLKGTSYQEGTPRADRQAKIAANTIWKFINEVSIGDKVLLCQGYAANQKKDVYVYGFAQVEALANYDENPHCWNLKREAKIEEPFIETEVPKQLLVELLKKGSLLKTLQEIKIKESDFEQLHERLLALASKR